MEVPIFLVMKFTQPTHIAVERASGYRAFDQSRGRSLRAVALAGGRWSFVNGQESFLAMSNRGALSTSDASFKFAERPAWFQESRCQLHVWNREHLGEIFCLLRSEWSLGRLDVCICADASEKKFFFFGRHHSQRCLIKEELMAD